MREGERDNFIRQLDWDMGHLGIGLNIIVEVPVKMFPDEINIEISRLSKAMGPLT